MFPKNILKLAKKLTFYSFFLFSISIILPLTISAEQTTGAIRGSVFDSSGNPVSGVSIQITHVPSGTKASQVLIILVHSIQEVYV